jgi:hypothetical protein
MRKIALLLLLPAALLHAQAAPSVAPPTPSAGSHAEPAIGAYQSSRINGKPLPMMDRASDENGAQYLIEFDELILAIRPNHEFRASLRYRQTLASKGSRISQDPIQKMTVYGAWGMVNGEIRFIPDPKRGGNGLRILNGTVTGRQINVPFDYRNGSVQRQATVLLLKNDNIY